MCLQPWTRISQVLNLTTPLLHKRCLPDYMISLDTPNHSTWYKPPIDGLMDAAQVEVVAGLIRQIGLAPTKARNIVKMSQASPSCLLQPCKDQQPMPCMPRPRCAAAATGVLLDDQSAEACAACAQAGTFACGRRVHHVGLQYTGAGGGPCVAAADLTFRCSDCQNLCKRSSSSILETSPSSAAAQRHTLSLCAGACGQSWRPSATLSARAGAAGRCGPQDRLCGDGCGLQVSSPQFWAPLMGVIEC